MGFYNLVCIQHSVTLRNHWCSSCENQIIRHKSGKTNLLLNINQLGGVSASGTDVGVWIFSWLSHNGLSVHAEAFYSHERRVWE